jgi:hypothetical protein
MRGRPVDAGDGPNIGRDGSGWARTALLAAAAVAAIASSSTAFAEDGKAKSTAPTAMSDSEMDKVTAGAGATVGIYSGVTCPSGSVKCGPDIFVVRPNNLGSGGYNGQASGTPGQQRANNSADLVPSVP